MFAFLRRPISFAPSILSPAQKSDPKRIQEMVFPALALRHFRAFLIRKVYQLLNDFIMMLRQVLRAPARIEQRHSKKKGWGGMLFTVIWDSFRQRPNPDSSHVTLWSKAFFPFRNGLFSSPRLVRISYLYTGTFRKEACFNIQSCHKFIADHWSSQVSIYLLVAARHCFIRLSCHITCYLRTFSRRC